MKKSLGILLLMAGGALAAPAFAADTYNIDPTHSLQIFRYRHLGLSFARGRFDKTTGTIVLDTAKKTGSAEVTIDVASMNTGVAKLDEHLKGPDFFDAAKYPLITFKSSRFKFKGKTPVAVSGDLTVHGVTRTVTLKITSFACHEHPMMKVPACAANATATIKRSEFGIGAYVPAVSDEVELDLEVEALQPPPEPMAQAK